MSLYEVANVDRSSLIGWIMDKFHVSYDIAESLFHKYFAPKDVTERVQLKQKWDTKRNQVMPAVHELEELTYKEQYEAMVRARTSKRKPVYHRR